MATKNQKEQQRPNGGKKTKTKQSTPIYSFNEKAKQAALRHIMHTSTRRLKCATSDAETNRYFLIFNTTEPKPPSIQIVNVDADPTNDKLYKITASNDPNDFIETGSFSPTTQRPQITTTSSLSKDNAPRPSLNINFNKSTKKFDKIVQKKTQKTSKTQKPQHPNEDNSIKI